MEKKRAEVGLIKAALRPGIYGEEEGGTEPQQGRPSPGIHGEEEGGSEPR